MTNDDLIQLREIAQADKDTQWVKIEHGVVCSLRDLLVIALTPKMVISLVTELLDARARIEGIRLESEEK